MLNSIAALLCGTAILALLYVCKKWASYRKFRAAATQHGCKRPPKYPHRDPIWGTDLTRQRMKAIEAGEQGKFFMKNFNNFGKTYEENVFGVRAYNTMQVQNFQTVYALNFQDYGKPGVANLKPFLGDGILASVGPAWKFSRDLVKPVFSRSELSDVDTLAFHVDRFLDKIPGDGTTIDLQQPLHNLFLDTASEFLFGHSTDAQLPDDPNNSKEFLEAFNGVLKGAGRRRLAGHLRHFIFAFDKTWKRDREKVYAYIDGYVKLALEEVAGEKVPATPTRYVLLTELARHIKDPIKLRYQILHVFAPGRDTSSILVANCFFHLARNPKVWNQLRAESLALGDQPLTFELLKSLHSFRHVIHETLRLQGPAGRAQRIALRDTMLPVGGGADRKAPVFVEKGDIVIINTWGSNHDPDIWGDDVNEFKPERFVNRKFTWEFTPFLGGPRICPAQQQVMTQVVYLLVRMTMKFARIENRDPILEYREVVRLITESRNGAKVAFFFSNVE